MSDEYIKKEDGIQSIIAHDLVGGDARGWAEYLLENASTVDVAPVRHGHWIIKCVIPYELSDGGTAYVPEYECSCCGFLSESYVRLDKPIMPEDADFPKYCGNCGARMDGEENETD